MHCTKLTLVVASLAALALSGCSGVSSGTPSGGSGNNSGGTVTNGSGNGEAVAGTAAGVVFTAIDGYAFRTHGNSPSVGLVFSSTAGVCSGIKDKRIPAGTNLFQVYALAVDGVGNYTSNETMLAGIDSACPSGESADHHVSVDDPATTTTVTITSVTGDAVEGHVSATFASGKIEGDFALPFCGEEPAGDILCK